MIGGFILFQYKNIQLQEAKTSELVGIVDHQETFDVELLGQIDQTTTPEGEFLFPFEVKFNCDQDKINLFNKSKLKEMGVSKGI